MNNLSGSKTAAYLRLSREDGDKLESDSIKNQRELIQAYIAQNRDLVFQREYVDDGYSGTNFDRPAFKELLEALKEGRINCVIVKDLSRLGRNYIETGKYLERLFPLLKVRFISILDHYDSASENNEADQIIIPFKNLINDAYCRDISTKIRSQLDVKRKNGKYIGSFACYGYRKDPMDKNRLIIDPYASNIVRMIFRMKLEGYSAQGIAEVLNEMGVLPPAEYKRRKGFDYDCGFRAGSNPRWEAVSVNRILTNEMVTGTMVQGINSKINYKVKYSRPVPKNEWIRVEGTHEPIIGKSVFEDVQRLLATDTRTSPEEVSVYLFSGLVVCGDCGQNMIRRSVTKGGKKYTYLHCSTYKNGGTCTSHLINVDHLETVVLDAVRGQISLVLRAEEILKGMDHITESQPYIKTISQQIDEMQAEAERFENKKAISYGHMLEGIISQDEFLMIKKRFSEKADQARAKLASLISTRNRLLKEEICIKPWIETFRKCRNVEKLERSLAVTLIDHIVVFDKKKISVVFRFQDEMQEMIEMAGLGRTPGEDGA